MSRSRIAIFVLGFVLLVGLVLGTGVWLRYSSYDASITIQVAPADSQVILDGKNVGVGTWRIKSGNHSLSFSRDGFTPVTNGIGVSKNQDYYAGVALVPTDPEFANWYADHPEDQKLAESISSQSFDFVNSQPSPIDALVEELPYINLLPYFRIDFGISKKYPNDPTKSAIYIRFSTNESKKVALDWIRGRGVDPSSLEIIYPSQ